MSYLNQRQERLGQELQVWMFTKWIENLSKKDEKSFSENSYNKQKPNTECSCCRVFPVQMHFSEMCTDAWKKVQMFVKSVDEDWKKSEQSDKTDRKNKV